MVKHLALSPCGLGHGYGMGLMPWALPTPPPKEKKTLGVSSENQPCVVLMDLTFQWDGSIHVLGILLQPQVKQCQELGVGVAGGPRVRGQSVPEGRLLR